MYRGWYILARMKRLAAALAAIAVALSAQSGRAQQPSPSSWAVHAINNYELYAGLRGSEVKVDPKLTVNDLTVLGGAVK